MKPSRYNVYVPAKKDTFILYNTFSKAIFFVDTELKEAIQKTPSKIPENALKDFKKEWVILEDDTDELQTIAVIRDELRYNSPWLQFMIMTTYACNLDCPYCYEKKESMTSMDTTTCKSVTTFIKSLIGQYRPTDLHFLMYGGEPLLHTEPLVQLLDSFAAFCEDTSINLHADIITNGTLLTPDIVAVLTEYPVKVVQVTLDGPKELHNKKRFYKSGKGTYEDIIAGLHLLKDSSLTPKIRVNVDKVNKNTICVLLDDLKERGLFVPLYFGIIRPMSTVCESYNPSCMQDAEIKSVIPYLWKESLKRGFDIPLKPYSNLVGCGMQSNSSYTLDPEGHVYKCVTGVGFSDQCIGTIDEHGQIPLWNPVYYKWMSRDPLQFKGCTVCTFFPLCGGGCPMIAYANHGTYDTGGCFEIKRVFKDQLHLYLQKTYPECTQSF